MCCNPQPLDFSHDALAVWLCANCRIIVRESTDKSNADIESVRFKAIMDQFAAINASISTCNSRIEVCNANVETCNANIDSCKISIDAINKLIDAQSDLIKQCSNDLAMLKSENENLKSRVLTLEQKQNVKPVSADELHYELTERHKREKNIIITGITEKIPNDDSCVVNKIIRLINPLHEAPFITIRLGAPNLKQPRAIKVVLDSPDSVREILRNRNKLVGTEFANVKVNTDLTPSQMKHLRELRSELENRTKAGEKNLTIKYINRAPKIITQNPLKRDRSLEDTSPSKEYEPKIPKSLQPSKN